MGFTNKAQIDCNSNWIYFAPFDMIESIEIGELSEIINQMESVETNTILEAFRRDQGPKSPIHKIDVGDPLDNLFTHLMDQGDAKKEQIYNDSKLKPPMLYQGENYVAFMANPGMYPVYRKENIIAVSFDEPKKPFKTICPINDEHWLTIIGDFNCLRLKRFYDIHHMSAANIGTYQVEFNHDLSELILTQK